MREHKIALVTGANRGIGLEIARQLSAKGFRVLVGSRNHAAGEKAVTSLRQSGAEAALLELDVTNPASIAKAAREVSDSVDHLDVLVNNAGVVEDGDNNALTVNGDLLLQTLKTNTLGPLRVAQAFHALLAKSKSPRIVNVSSGGGQLSEPSSWAPAYCISKTALNAVTVQLAAALPGVAVNSACPGWVRTDMGGQNAPRSVEEGADTIVWLATEAPQTLTGKFVSDRKVIPW